MDSECKPIFIVGSARTGTSVMVAALRSGADIAGYNEGHFLSLLPDTMNLFVNHILEQKKKNPSPLVMMSHLRIDNVMKDVMEMMKRRMEEEFTGKKVWLDKTPDGRMIRSIPYLIKMWPKARFIFTKRRAIENMESRLRKFKHLSFERNCEHWAASMELWDKMKENIPESQRIEIDQREMALNPKNVAAQLVEFLKLSQSQGKKIEDIFKNERHEFTGGDERLVKSLCDLNWSKEDTDTFKKICLPWNKKFGYGEDSNYYIPKN